MRKEKKAQVMKERDALKRHLHDVKRDFSKLFSNFDKALRDNPKDDKLNRILEENKPLLTSIGGVLLNKDVIRTDEIDRMRIFYGGLTTTNMLLTFKIFEGTEIKVKDDKFPPPPFGEIYSIEKFGNYVQTAKRSWEQIKKDYELK